MQQKPVQYSMYLSGKDCDLQLLYKNKMFGQAARLAVRRYLKKDRELFIDPPEDEMLTFTPKRIKLYFYPERDQDIIDFLAKIPKGNLNLVMQTMIRNAYRFSDIRHWMRETVKANAEPQKTSVVKASPTMPKQQVTITTRKEETRMDEDDIFAGI